MVTKSFVTAGRAIFTVKSITGSYYTYRVTRKDNTWFVGLLTGPDNTSSYTYMGILDADRGEVILTKASKFADESLPVRVLRWAIRLVWNDGTLPTGYSLDHAGMCGRCGRTLTVPESIATGLGPECSRLVGI